MRNSPNEAFRMFASIVRVNEGKAKVLSDLRLAFGENVCPLTCPIADVIVAAR
jgi:hypothetical protein